MAQTTVNFTQLVAAEVRDKVALFGLATNGEVYEYSPSREGWVPLPMVILRAPDDRTEA